MAFSKIKEEVPKKSNLKAYHNQAGGLLKRMISHSIFKKDLLPPDSVASSSKKECGASPQKNKEYGSFYKNDSPLGANRIFN